MTYTFNNISFRYFTLLPSLLSGVKQTALSYSLNWHVCCKYSTVFLFGQWKQGWKTNKFLKIWSRHVAHYPLPWSDVALHFPWLSGGVMQYSFLIRVCSKAEWTGALIRSFSLLFMKWGFTLELILPNMNPTAICKSQSFRSSVLLTSSVELMLLASWCFATSRSCE